MNYEVIVELKKEVLDAEGRAIKESLSRLGHQSLHDVKVSKRFVIDIDGSESDALETAQKLASEYLANPVSQTFKVRKLDQS